MSGMMRSVEITPVLNGFIVRVGCQVLVFNTIEEVAKNLVDYQKMPNEVEKSFIKNAVNKTIEEVGQELPQVRPTNEPIGARQSENYAQACANEAPPLTGGSF